MNAQIWDLYLKDVEIIVKQFKGFKEQTYQKAIKASPNLSQYWIPFMFHHQSQNAPSEIIQDFFRVASGCAGAPEQQFALMRHFTLYFVRRLKSGLDDSEGVQDVRENFDAALQNLNEFPELQHQMAKLAAEIEFEHFFQTDKRTSEQGGSFKDSVVQRVKKCMELVVRHKQGNTQENWVFFGKLFVYMEEIKEARKVYTRGMNYCVTQKGDIIKEWLKLEETKGTAESILAAQSKIRSKGGEIHPVEQEQEKKETHSNKRKQTEAMKRKLTYTQNLSKVKHTLFFKNIPEQLTEEMLEGIINSILEQDQKNQYQVTIVRNNQGFSKGFAFVDFEEKEIAEKALALHNMELDGRKCSVQFSKPPSKGENDYRTIFVNNLSFSTTEDELETLFGDYGEITEIRLIKDNKGKAKGYGYVEFSKEEEAEAAVSKMDKERISGRVISVMKANSVRKEKQESERTVHLSNIPYEATETQIEEEFSKFGIVKKFYLPRTHEGTIKGFAFIEYESEEAAKRAVRTKTVHILGRGVLIRKSTRKITAPVDKDGFKAPQPVKRKKVEGVKSNDDFASSLFSK